MIITRKAYSANELKKLGWWRGVLAFIVVLDHLTEIIWFPVLGDRNSFVELLGNLGNLSVVFFFVLSGVLISYSALNVCENGSFDWWKYLRNRITRIYPTLAIVLLFCAVLIIVFPFFNNGRIAITKIPSDRCLAREFFTTAPFNFVKTLFMLQPGIKSVDGPLWSLFIEWWLYISALFLFLALYTLNKPFLKCAYLVLAIAVLYLAYYGFGKRVIIYIAIWYIGFLYTIYFRFNRRAFNVLILLSCLGFVAVLTIFGIKAINYYAIGDKVYGILQILYAILFIRISFRVSGWSIFREMGDYSYTLYILHFPLILFSFAVLRSSAENNVVILFVETSLLIPGICLMARMIARYTEDKFWFRNRVDSILLKWKKADTVMILTDEV